MESNVNHGNESDYDMGYGGRGSPDYGLDLDVEELRGSEDEQVMHANPVGEESAAPDVDAYTEPYEGMEFETEEEAWTFYNVYAKQMGFTTRVNNYHRSRRDGSITSREFVCAEEGFRKTRGRCDPSCNGKIKRLRGIVKVACKAMVRVRKQENGKWVVSKFQKVHNHSMASQRQAHCLCPNSFTIQGTRGTVGTFQGLRLDQSIDSMPECREPQQTLHSKYTSEDHICYTGVGEPSNIGRETLNILEYLKRMQAEDSAFFYELQFDDDQCMGNVFWVDAKSRMAYKYFSDSVIFDTSYKTNQYQIPLAIFSGVNHHRQPVLFGCALLVDDSLSSLIWMFKTFLSAMSDRHPLSLITDPDRDIQVALTHVFPETRHRLCKWHILKEGQEKLSNVYRSYPSFGGEIQKCINETETIDEFESCWWMLVSRYNLGDNEWLQSIYNFRQQWVPVFLHSSFSVELSSAQRCEGRSTFFEGHISAQTPPHAFIQQYEKALDSRYEKEVKADFDTIYSLPHLKTPSPMEKQAAESYTRKLFGKFQEEFIQTFVYTANKINEEGSVSTFKVTKFEEQHKAYIVMFDSSDTKATCSCQLFENSGILCRHILTVFSITSVITIPPHYILKRWTRHAKKDDESVSKDKLVMDEAYVESQSKNLDSRESLTRRYNSLCREAIKYAEDGATSIDIYNVAIRALQEAVKKVTAAKASIGKAGQSGSLASVRVGNQVNKTKAKDLQIPQANVTEQATSSHGCNVEGHMLVPPGIMQLIPGQEAGKMLFQQPFNLVLIAPGLLGDSGLPNASPAAPVAFNFSDNQAQFHSPVLAKSNQGMNLPIPIMVQNKFASSAASGGNLDGKRPVLISLPGGSIQDGDIRHGSAQLPAQILDSVIMGQANPSPPTGSNSAGSLARSEPQLMAVTMAYVPMMGNVPVACSAAPANSNSSGSSPGIQSSSLATFPITLMPREAAPASPLVPPMVASASINPVPAAAVAPGLPATTPTAAVSIRAAQARNIARRRSHRGSSSLSTKQGGYKTLVPRTWIPQPQNAHLCFIGRSPKEPSGAVISPGTSQIDDRQMKVDSSKQAVSPDVVILDDPGHTEKEPAQVRMRSSGRMATLTAQVSMPKAAEQPGMGAAGTVTSVVTESSNEPSNLPEEPSNSRIGFSSGLEASTSTGTETSVATESSNEPYILPEEPNNSETGDSSGPAASTWGMDTCNDSGVPNGPVKANSNLVNSGSSDEEMQGKRVDLSGSRGNQDPTSTG